MLVCVAIVSEHRLGHLCHMFEGTEQIYWYCAVMGRYKCTSDVVAVGSLLH
jgi:hypothetical protein